MLERLEIIILCKEDFSRLCFCFFYPVVESLLVVWSADRLKLDKTAAPESPETPSGAKRQTTWREQGNDAEGCREQRTPWPSFIFLFCFLFLGFQPFFCPREDCRSQEALSSSWQVGEEGGRVGSCEGQDGFSRTERWKGDREEVKVDRMAANKLLFCIAPWFAIKLSWD